MFLDETKILLEWLRTLSYEELKKLWNCNDRIASQNDERVRHMDLEKGLTPAILSYEGIQYQYMAPAVFEERPWCISRSICGSCQGSTGC